MKQQKARHVGEGLALGFRDFGIGLYKGVTGIVTEPIKGVQKEGALGLLKGVGKGITGVVFKPMVGAVDLVTRTTEGIKNTATLGDAVLKVRVRPPRHIGPEKIVRLYNFKRAVAQELLVTADNGKYRRERLVAQLMLPAGSVLILTDRAVLLVKKAAITLGTGSAWTCDWHVLLAACDGLASVRDGSLCLRSLPLKRTDSVLDIQIPVDARHTRTRKYFDKLNSAIAHATSQRLLAMQRVERQMQSKRTPTIIDPSHGSKNAPVIYDAGTDKLIVDESSSEESPDQIIARRQKEQQRLRQGNDKDGKGKGKQQRIKGSAGSFFEQGGENETAPLLGDKAKDKEAGCCSCCTIC